jgi:glycerol-3-phosphate dehydrogenase
VKRDLPALAVAEHDLLVVGGGIYGAAAAWDAAQRGLRVALVERDDFGSGTSWNSLKTIHGGLRHLQRLELGELRESIRERRALLRIAPELVRPLSFLVPAYGHGPKGREALGLGLWLHDRIARDRNRGLPAAQRIPPARLLSRGEALALVPGLPQRGLAGAALWTDAQVRSSERLVVALLCAAAGAGAMLANHAEVTGLLRCRERVVGVRVHDRLDGRDFEVLARVVLNAAGPWVDGLLDLAGIARRRVPLLRSYNLVLRRPSPVAHAVGARSTGRFLFLVPWGERSMVGTGYEPAEAPEPEAGIRRFLEDAGRAFPWAELGAQDVSLVHLGLVPGSGGPDGLWTRSFVVDHEEEHRVPGLLSIYGAKYTTARAVAEKAVDRAFARLGRRTPRCRTAETPLAEARVLEGSLGERARHAVRAEMARSLADAVLRRLDLGTAGPPPEAEIDEVARVLAGELGWDEAQILAEKEALGRALDKHRFPLP